MTDNKMKKQKESYSYLRRLTGAPDEREYRCIVRTLQEEGVERYIEDGNGEYRLADEPAGAVLYTENGVGTIAGRGGRDFGRNGTDAGSDTDAGISDTGAGQDVRKIRTLYVTAADAEYARDAAECALRALYEEPDGEEADRAVKRALTKIEEEMGPQDEATKAAQEYIRRQRSIYLQWAIVIVVMMVFMIVRAWIGI